MIAGTAGTAPERFTKEDDFALRTPFLGLRRTFFFGLVATTTLVGGWMTFGIVRSGGVSALEVAILLLFAPTFGWISIAFWTACIGFVLRVLGMDPIRLRRLRPASGEGPLHDRTALVVPVHNEEPERVMGAMEATLRSLLTTGHAAHFDVFLLSDTTDPTIADVEERAWLDLRERIGPPYRLTYRRRPENVGRKAGNLADFCHRWGEEYDHMVVLDADSIMSGDALVSLVRLMEQNPRAALVQTVPLPARQDTLFGRIIQFGVQLQSPLLASGQSFWQGETANYWGHNAILRIKPFREHCRLPVLPGRPPLGGEVLSHDFVEAALLRRAGWRVYLAPWIEGSFEEVPENILDYARRDRRWAQGSLQHLRLLRIRGLHPLSRVHFGMGAMGYLSSVLWLLMLLAGTLYVGLVESGVILVPLTAPLGGPLGGSAAGSLARLGIPYVSLLAVTAGLLFIPKGLGVLLGLRRRSRRSWGGAGRLLLSACLETLFAIIVAPILMIYHSRFVASILLGRSVAWEGRTRGGGNPSWRAAWRETVAISAVGVAWTGLTLAISATFFLWLLPIFVGLLLAAPIVRLAGSRKLGDRARKLGLFLAPSETEPHHVTGQTLEPLPATIAGVAEPPGRRRRTMRRLSTPSILIVGLFCAAPSVAQQLPDGFDPGAPVERTYGLGLPRSMDVLYIPDSDYPDWPLRPDQTAYADVDGARMKGWVRRISAISLQSRDDGNMYWGRLPGTPYDAMTMDLMVGELERLGLEIERVPHTIPTDWYPTFWEASYTAGDRSVELQTAFPAGETAATLPEGITADAVWVGVGAEPDFLGRDVRGKAVVIYSTFVPGGRSHSASDRAGIFNANTRASELGAAMIINIMAVPGNAQFNPLGAPSADYGVPLITVSQDEGFALRDALGTGETVTVHLQLDIDIRENVQTANVFARLPGMSDEEIIIAMHTDGYFQAAFDNASGMASGLEIARHYAALPREERPRTLVFLLFPDHHHGEVGLRAWERTYDWDNVAMALTLEHPSQTQLYWYNDDLMTANTIGAFRWNAMGSPDFLQLVKDALRDFGVSIYTVMDGSPKLTRQAPGFHIIDHVIYHTTLDTPELVPAEGMERATRAFLAVIDQVNRMTLAELRSPEML